MVTGPLFICKIADCKAELRRLVDRFIDNYQNYLSYLYFIFFLRKTLPSISYFLSFLSLRTEHLWVFGLLGGHKMFESS